ncbi:MAG TPA: hypothetical protein VNA88_03090 [Candidatus Kapabacteria bacterium]|nr:hypothetical protein [Candidatus Kapabacteria bacterium]
MRNTPRPFVGRLVAMLVAMLVAVLAAATAAHAQTSTDTSRSSWLDRISLDLSGATWYEPTGAFVEHSAPAAIASRRPGETLRRWAWELDETTVSDNPLIHVGVAVTFGVSARPIDGLLVRGELLGEIRGFSYGATNLSNALVVPRVALTIDTSTMLAGDTLGFVATFGHMADVRVDEGLMLYNIDVQGVRAAARWRSVRLGYTKVADLYAGIGLGVQDYDELWAGLAGVQLADEMTAGVSAGLISMPRAGERIRYAENSPRAQMMEVSAMGDFSATLSGRVATGSHAIYGQLAMRDGTSEHILSRAAWVAGARSALGGDDASIDLNAEYRFYGGLFNAERHTLDVEYRDPERPLYGNTIGPSYYPLAHFDRPFSQWAVFTEYQDLKDVEGATLTAEARVRIGRTWALRGSLDLNHVAAEGLEGFLYAFYAAGIAWEPSPRFTVGMAATNRAMNLDKSYPTLYQMSMPTALLTMRWTTK